MARTFSHVTFSPALSPPLPLALSFQMRTKWKREKMEHEPLGVGTQNERWPRSRGGRARGETPEPSARGLPQPDVPVCVPLCARDASLRPGSPRPPLPPARRGRGGVRATPGLSFPGSEGVQDTRSRGPFSCREGAIGAETPSRGPGLSQGVTRASAPPSPPPCWDWDMSAPRREPREGSGHPSSLSGASLVCTVGRSRGRHWVTLS